MLKIVLISGAVLATAIAAGIGADIATKPKPLTFEERWQQTMQDLYVSQDNLRKSGHVSEKGDAICTKKYCDRHPSMIGKEPSR